MKIVTAHPIVDGILDEHRGVLGTHMATYRNHVYRGLNYQQALLKASLPDSAALAWAVHDLGIWTAGTFDYLAPSADLAETHAKVLGVNDIDDARRMILEHHKLRRVHDRLVDTFRAADLADVSRGILPGPVGRAQVKAVVAELPYLGFHAFLADGLTRHAVRHPARPLPMLRW
jgi:hypothetical protein